MAPQRCAIEIRHRCCCGALPPLTKSIFLPQWGVMSSLSPVVTGRVTGFGRTPRGEQATEEAFRFNADAGLLTGPGVYDDVAYVGSQDANVYAISMTPGGQVLWPFASGAPR